MYAFTIILPLLFSVYIVYKAVRIFVFKKNEDGLLAGLLSLLSLVYVFILLLFSLFWDIDVEWDYVLSTNFENLILLIYTYIGIGFLSISIFNWAIFLFQRKNSSKKT
jgi:hypothetical protein